MTTVIHPELLMFGAPASLTIGGVEVGATTDNPKVTITPTIYTPEFTNAKGPVQDTDIITKLLVAAEFTVDEFTGTKISWAMPGITDTANTFTWTVGRIPTASYKDVVLAGIGLDGRTLTVSIYNAVNVSPVELDFSNSEIMGMKVRMEGRYDGDTPTLAPFQIVWASGS